MTHQAAQDAEFREVFLSPIRKCAKYRPVFGQGRSSGLSLSGFQQLYGGDSFYAWLGLDAPAVYAAHKAAGGLTSVYRQIGVGSERLFRSVLGFSLGLSESQMEWSYEYVKPDGKKGLHTLDARIRVADLSGSARSRFTTWLEVASSSMGGSSNGAIPLHGAVFEVRQGYKSADSKRQNADLRYGVRAYQAGLLPAFAIMSSQISDPVLRRYRGDGMLVLTGFNTEDELASTSAFFTSVVGYDLAAFFERNSPVLKQEVQKVVSKLLTA